jgi:hypothetical protein
MRNGRCFDGGDDPRNGINSAEDIMFENGMRAAAVAALAVAGLTACDEGAGPEGQTPVAVAFSANGTTTTSALRSASAMRSPWGVQSVTVAGTNGTLVIDELRIIVAEFELDRVDDDACANDDATCEDFEAPPAFVNVPLDGGDAVAVTAAVTPNTYDELEFEIEDLEDDEDDPVKAQQIEDLMAEILAEFPDWPRQASMLAVGTFTPTDGEPVAFRVYFEAEVEIELDLSPPVTVTDDGSGASFTINIDPALWFTGGDGTVMNLAELDFDRTGAVVEFEVEIENGFSEVEFEDD